MIRTKSLIGKKQAKTKQLLLLNWRSPILVFAFTILSLTISYPANAQEKMLRTLTVTGEGIERIPTTLTQVQLGVEIQGQTATEVQQELANRSSALVDFLRSRQVQQLQTTGIQLQTNYDYSNNQRRLIGYIGTNTVSFRLNTEKVGSLLDEAVKIGATRIDGVSFIASDSAIATATQQALRNATLNAQQQAEAVLKSLNLTSKEIVSIQLNGANIPSPKMFQPQRLSAATSDASSPVIGGEQTINASVTLQISY